MKHNISITVDNLTEEAFIEIQEKIKKLTRLERIGNPRDYDMNLNIFNAFEAEQREICIYGIWPDIIYDVTDFVTDREEKIMTKVGSKEYEHSELE